MNVVFRADARPDIGSGHVVRCLALADALRARQSSVRFVSAGLPAPFQRQLADRGLEVREAGSTAESSRAALSDRQWDWLVVDHYELDAEWERAVRGPVSRILVIDDLANRPHDCDLLLDQNLHDDMPGRYEGRVPAGCHLLLGPRYALLREEFARERERVKPRDGAVRRILVCFGGVDAGNATEAALRGLIAAGTAGMHVDVVIGALHPQRQAIQALCEKQQFACHVDTPRMAALMAAADLAIGAGGTATWERCCLGLPALVFAIADNQRCVVEQGARRGLFYAPDVQPEAGAMARHVQALLENVRLRHLISRRALDAVDGRGVERVLRAVEGDAVVMREATAGDAEALFAWRNHASVRAASRGKDPISWTDHLRWLTAVTADPARVLLIGEREGQPVGVVRFDVDGDAADVSIYRVPASPGRGLGPRLLEAGESWLASRHPGVVTLRAEVLDGNAPSQRLFEDAGYRNYSTVYRKRPVART
jgi:UDP-2,4-diacetamido-2,4,6-trideoxy-beta-L-altropyranose hydrolase